MPSCPRPLRQLLRQVILALLLGLAGAAQAQTQTPPLEQAQALWLVGERERALDLLLQALRGSPEDARLRFAAAAMQMELGQREAAEPMLLALTQDYPDLADPYNNLAVLYAGRGELDRARAMLEQALRLQPEHVQAAENLGDVLLRLAERAYQLALKNGSGPRPALQLKLSRTRAALPAAE